MSRIGEERLKRYWKGWLLGSDGGRVWDGRRALGSKSNPTYQLAAVESLYHRLPILTTDESTRSILHAAWLDVRGRFPFKTVAVCLLPEHLHCIWSLPERDAAYPVRWKEIKRLFTKAYLDRVGPGEERNASRLKQGEAAIWQRRYWEHIIRDEDDLRRHEDTFITTL